MARVTAAADPAIRVDAARITVRLTDGRVLEERVAAARGTPDNPLTREEVEAKFTRLAGVVLPTDRVARLAAALRRLPEVGDVAEIAALAAG